MQAAAGTKKLGGALIAHKDLLIAFILIGVIAMMIIPLPPFMLDVLLTVMISLAIIIMLISMYIDNVLDFSVFPGMLLIITLFRLGLNVATTRLILTEGEAGGVIHTFGTFVTKGNMVVGAIIFIILVIIQFIVITKGAGRIAEVAARFTLDAMPGKQMAVDADLNAGIITEAEAKDRRRNIGREADFYGAMDGASKFVRGDAIAGIIITVINIIGGFIVGMTMQDLSFQDSIKRFTILTIGDGLVTQMPALMISTASGIIVARAASKQNLGEEVMAQLTQSTKAMYTGAGFMGVTALIPGMPTLPFLLLASMVGGLAFLVGRKKVAEKAQAAVEKEKKAEEKDAAANPDKIESYLQVDQMELEIGYGLISLVDVNQGGDLLERITMLRRQCATEIGVIVPPIRIRDNIQLKANQYVVKIKGIEVGQGELMTGCFLAMDPGGTSQKIQGIPTVEPAFGLPAIWITHSQKEAADIAGYTVVELPAVIATHLTELIRNHAGEILTRQDVKSLIDNMKATNATVVEELIPGLMGIGDVQRVLVNLLNEKVSIRDLGTVLEALANASKVSKSEAYLTEQCRQALSRQICKAYKDAGDCIHVISLEPKLEQMLEASVQNTDRGPRLVIRPELVGRMVGRLSALVERMVAQNMQPVLLCSPGIRFQLRKIMEGSFPNLALISYSEIANGVNVKATGTVVLNDNESGAQ
ncbi:MAG TPA: flagellar biosynthesis protein FlhA [Fibrobacteria bacterium]|nr:flagellar biosynthesis protein FlhA [Fibrobacteria bacterium]